ncbi:MAG: RagB/SusD family nutrient uptake outer membrane protein [Bacteroidaceae bacterium]|nr:RagB/SusD family nutrient uptake outer membrane protein [Bacteroidaceae bacterium]
MKKLALYMLGAAVVLSGCNDILDSDPYDQFTKDIYFTSETNVEMFANYFYSEFSGYGNSGSYGNYYFNNLNDDQGTTGLASWSFTAVPATAAAWNTPYTEIRRANTLIAALPNVESMSETKKAHWMGVARLYRGWQHFKLVRAYGNCYYVDKELDSSDEDVLYGPRQDRNTVMDRVLEDLNYAVGNISENGTSRTAINVYVAQAMKAQVCLFEGTYSKYVLGDASRASKYLTEAKAACDAIMNSGQYQLNASYHANFNSLDLSGNKEMILYKKYIYGTLAHSTIDYTCGSTQVNGMSKAAFDSYLFIDGLPKATTKCDTSEAGVLVNFDDKAGFGPQDHIDISALLAQRDPRLSDQIDHILMFPGSGYARFGGAQSTSGTGYGVLLFDTDLISTANRQSISGNDTDAPIFWLAEILLDYAEIQAELGAITQSDLDKTINLLRDRAGMPHLTLTPQPDPANNMGVSDLLWEIRRERRVEMMYAQNDRYYSLQRWNQLDKLDTAKYPDQARGAYVGNFAGTSLLEQVSVDADGYINCSNGNTRTYDSKYMLFPIPSGQRDLNPQLDQNPGW